MTKKDTSEGWGIQLKTIILENGNPLVTSSFRQAQERLRDFIAQEKEKSFQEGKREAQREIFKNLDHLGMPPALMAIVKDFSGVKTEEITGLDSFTQEEEEK